MLYYALVLLVLALVLLGLGFAGVVPGAAGLANLSLLAGFVLLAFAALSRDGHHRQLRH